MGAENKIERKLKNEVEKHGGKCLKFLSSESGVPDRIVLFPMGKVVFIELKAPGKKPRPLQVVQMKRIKKLGFEVRVIDSMEGITSLINELKTDGRK